MTLLREHRGDGHVSALVAAGVGPCEAHVLRIADDGLPLDSIQPYRGWDDDDWADAADRLHERETFWTETGAPHPRAHVSAAEIEQTTDRLSATLVDRVDDLDVVLNVLGTIARRLADADVIPYPNPMGVPAPISSG